MKIFLLLLPVFIIIDAAFDAYEYNYRRYNSSKSLFFNFKVLLLISSITLGYIIGKMSTIVYLSQFSINELYYLIRLCSAYLLMRFAIFNIIFNLLTGLDWYYIGVTKILDRFQNWITQITKFPSIHFWTMFRLVCLLISIGLILNYD